ncbi:polysaccharide pyruvyl transferase family protein [Clostridium perfringens]|uniref:polysaccharide pyruvyl transferase family protein n=1 Tax=Clostridium perfringens TaxID=1502 RepID=UPI0012FE290D|nr:polysaccharide pyruvyl transferase family protein [Clostridium perfringens]
MSKVLEKLNHEPKIVDFIYEKDLEQYKYFRTHLYKTRKQAIFADILYLRRNKMRKKNFEIFRRNYLNITDKSYFFSKDRLDELNYDFDAFICGSDQIWNLNCTESFVPEYFLNFANDDKLKISYAPSMPSKVDTKYYEEIKFNVERLDKVSVREKFTVDYLKDELEINKDIKHVVDPTLLLSADEYIQEFDLHTRDNNERYIFVYVLGGRDKHSTIINEVNRVQEITGAKIKYTCNRVLKGLNNAEYCYGIGPKEFLELLYNATYVVTDSFHATVFSILFSKKLCVFPRSGSSSRMKELLANLEIEHCLFEKQDDIWINENTSNRNLDYLNRIKAPSIDFISNSLK